nr:hypothetical protein CFP56_59668 [Quercus suber]
MGVAQDQRLDSSRGVLLAYGHGPDAWFYVVEVFWKAGSRLHVLYPMGFDSLGYFQSKTSSATYPRLAKLRGLLMT